MKKVLLVSMGEVFRGIEKLELDWMNNLNGYDVYMLVTNNNTLEGIKHNNHVISLNATRKSVIGRIKYDIKLFKHLKNNKYDIIHINSSAFFYSFRVALISKLCGIKKIIVHSHTEYRIKPIKRFFITLLNPLYRSLCNDYLSCSDIAESSLFTNGFIKKNKITIVNNGIVTNDYKFNKTIRNRLIKKYNLDGKIVYGHTGRMTYQKNQLFLIDIFYEIQKKQPNSILMLIGDGELKKQVEEKITKLNIKDKVMITGFKSNINELLNCIDVFLFPSRFEGFGLSIIESQANGIITYCSENVPKEANITNLFRYFKLSDSPKTIASRILKENLNIDRISYNKIIKQSGYDIESICKELGKIYSK